LNPFHTEEVAVAISTEGLPPIPKNTLTARTELLKTINEISSGERNSSAADNPAGIAIATNLVAEIASTNAARQNTVGAIASIRVAGGGVNSSTDALLRLRDLAVAASSSTLDDGARNAIQTEVNSIIDFVDQVSETTEFNGTPLLNGDAGELTFQVGPDAGADNQITVQTPDIGAESLGIDQASVATVESAQELIQTVDSALQQLGDVKAGLGASEATLATAHDRASGELISKQGALSNRRDTDMASASTGLAQELVLVQAQVAMRAQSNASASVTLKLLG
jgi:flagellin